MAKRLSLLKNFGRSLAMRIEYSTRVQKQMRKLDSSVRDRIHKYMAEVALLENPRSRGKALTGSLAGLWRYRVGDYRVVCNILDDQLIVSVINIGHRSLVYKMLDGLPFD